VGDALSDRLRDRVCRATIEGGDDDEDGIHPDSKDEEWCRADGGDVWYAGEGHQAERGGDGKGDRSDASDGNRMPA